MTLMKKTAALILALLACLTLCAACGETEEPGADPREAAAKEEPEEIKNLKTLGDAFALPEENFRNEGFSDTDFVYAFDHDGVYYRVIAALPADVSDAIWAIDFLDEERDSKVHQLVASLEIARLENLSKMIPPQEELDAWVGKTGADLLNDGWWNSGWDLDEMVFWMNKGLFEYEVTFDYDGKMENTDDFDFEAAISPLTVKSVTFKDFGDVTDADTVSD